MKGWSPMKKLLAALVVFSLAGLTGCPEHKSGSGGGAAPGAPGGGSFKVVEKNPKGTVEITQGDTVPVILGIDRDKNFHGDVTVDAKLATGPGGMTNEEVARQLEIKAEPNVLPGDKQDATATMQVTAKPDAKLGDYGISVSGTPKSGAGNPTAKPLEIKVRVKARADNKPPDKKAK